MAQNYSWNILKAPYPEIHWEYPRKRYSPISVIYFYFNIAALLHFYAPFHDTEHIYTYIKFAHIFSTFLRICRKIKLLPVCFYSLANSADLL